MKRGPDNVRKLALGKTSLRRLTPAAMRPVAGGEQEGNTDRIDPKSRGRGTVSG